MVAAPTAAVALEQRALGIAIVGRFLTAFLMRFDGSACKFVYAPVVHCADCSDINAVRFALVRLRLAAVEVNNAFRPLYEALRGKEPRYVPQPSDTERQQLLLKLRLRAAAEPIPLRLPRSDNDDAAGAGSAAARPKRDGAWTYEELEEYLLTEQHLRVTEYLNHVRCALF